MSKSLPIPEDVLKDGSLAEVLRVWRDDDGRVYVSWDNSQDNNSEGVGVFLGAIANVIASRAGDKQVAVRKSMTQGFRQAARAYIPDHPETFPKLFNYNEIVSAFHADSDRAAGILCAAWLDNYFGECLRYFLVQGKETRELVGDDKLPDRPLSSFKTRARALFCLGLLSKSGLEDVSIIVKVRNYFAHHPNVTSFDDTKIKEWCGNLRVAKQNIGETARLNYLFATSHAAIELNNILMQAHSIEPAFDIDEMIAKVSTKPAIPS